MFSPHAAATVLASWGYLWSHILSSQPRKVAICGRHVMASVREIKITELLLILCLAYCICYKMSLTLLKLRRYGFHALRQHNCYADTNWYQFSIYSVSTQYQLSISQYLLRLHGTNTWHFHRNALVLLLEFLIFYNRSHTTKILFQDRLRLSEMEFSISPSKLVSA